jgi:ribonuclease HII
MASDPARLSVVEIRRRFVQGGEPVSGQFLNRLRRDRRQGVRQLHDALRRRQEREREERLRLDAMLNFERVLWRSGLTRIAGVDEVGIGPLAGPVVAAAVVFPPGAEVAGVDDSKRLDPERREELAVAIRAAAAAIGIGVAEVPEIDRLNVYHAGCLAMRRAVEALPEPPQHLLLDARELPDLPIPQNRFDKGDGIDFSIAAASIVAKTHRDALMAGLDRRYPEYGFARHKGYGTKEHQEAIREHGPCEIHRLSFQFIHELCGALSELFYELRERLGKVESRRDLAAFEEALPEHRDRLAEGEYKKLRLMVTRRWGTI